MAEERHGRQLRGETTPLALCALVVGLACLFSTLLIYSGTVISFLRLEQTELFVGAFAETTLLACAVIGALLAGTSLAGKQAPFMLLAAGGGVLYICCSLAFACFSWIGSFGAPYVTALSLATALADASLALVWGRLCSRFTMKQALVAVSLASAGSAGICFLYATLPLPGVTALFVLATIVAVIVPLAFSDAARCDLADAAPERDRQHRALSTAASLADVIVGPGLGLLVFAFVMAVMRTSFNESQISYLAALSIDAVALLAYATLRKKRFSLRGGLHQTFLPLMATVLLAATSITATVGHGGEATSFLTYALYSLAALLTLATLCAIAHAGEFSSDLVFSTAVLLFAAASFLGQSFASALGDDLVNVAVTVTTTLYAFALVLSAYLRQQRDASWSRGDKDEQASVEAPGSESVEVNGTAPSADARCARIAREHRLTAREQEILAYLAEGHTGAFISDALFISPNTTRTHIHNIYRKLGVSSREDVLRITKG